MSDKRYYGQYHTFTDRLSGGDIYLRGGAGENLNLTSSNNIGITATNIDINGVLTTDSIFSNNAYAYVTGVGAQSIPTGSNTTLTGTYWDGTPTITGSASEIPTFSNGVYTINKAGLYFISVGATISGNASFPDGLRALSIKKNGTGNYGYMGVRASDSTNRTGLRCNAILSLVATDTISSGIFQNSGTSLSMNAGISGEFTIYRIQ